mgnify:CR=1 FL=1
MPYDLRYGQPAAEAKDRLKRNALGLSGGQQQRLCIARALAQPDGPISAVMLFSGISILICLSACAFPYHKHRSLTTSALDPISTSHIEELAMKLKEKYTIVIVTHNMQQAVRISDHTAF